VAISDAFVKSLGDRLVSVTATSVTFRVRRTPEVEMLIKDESGVDAGEELIEAVKRALTTQAG
jgi:hypothetical protein